jgi:putative ABC transport system substrate-binding protein
MWLTIFRLAALCAALIGTAEAQQPKMPRIGFLSAATSAAVAPRVEAFRQGLKELGYIEGKTIAVEYRWGDGTNVRLAEFAAELTRLKVDVIVSAGPAATRRAKEATSSIPIVMAFDNDPVGSGFVASLARPGGSITGLSALAPEITGKQLELLKEIVPKLSRVAVLDDPTTPGNAQALKEVQRAAGAFAIQLQHINVRDSGDFEVIYGAATKQGAQAVLVLTSALATSQRARITGIAARNRLPTMYFSPEFVDHGGLVTYGTSFTDLYRRAAAYVDKILKGAKPAALPVEQPTKFELAINLKAARQIGLTVPPGVLARADKVIE